MLGKEQERLREEVRAQAEHAQRAQEVISQVQAAREPTLPLGQVIAMFASLRAAYREEYVMYNLSAAALAQVRVRSSLCCLCAAQIADLTRLVQASKPGWEAHPGNFLRHLPCVRLRCGLCSVIEACAHGKGGEQNRQQ